jgi:PAS domain-containing protein
MNQDLNSQLPLIAQPNDDGGGGPNHGPQKKRRAISRKACENCRKAHACCSDSRPCKRCLSLDISCFDIPSKKRGRKRKFTSLQVQTPDANGIPKSPTQQQIQIQQLAPPTKQSRHTDMTTQFYNTNASLAPKTNGSGYAYPPYIMPQPSMNPYAHPPHGIYGMQHQQHHPQWSITSQHALYPPGPVMAHPMHMQQAYYILPDDQQMYTTGNGQLIMQHAPQHMQQPMQLPPSLPTRQQIPMERAPPILPPPSMQQQQLQSPTSPQTVMNSGTDAQIKIGLLQSLLNTSMIMPSAKRTENNGPGYVLYKLIHDESFNLNFWELVESFVATHTGEVGSSAPARTVSGSQNGPCQRGGDGVCYLHSDCIKEDLINKFHTYVKNRMTEWKDKEHLSNCPYLIMQESSHQFDDSPPQDVYDENLALHCPHLKKIAEVATEKQFLSEQNILNDDTRKTDQHVLPSASSLLSMFPSDRGTSNGSNASKKPGPDEIYIRQVLDMCNVGVILYMFSTGSILLWNDKAIELLGYNDSDLRTKVKTWMDILHPVHLPLTQRLMDGFEVKPMLSPSKMFKVDSYYYCQHNKTGDMIRIAAQTTNFVDKKFAVLRFEVLPGDLLNDVTPKDDLYVNSR